MSSFSVLNALGDKLILKKKIFINISDVASYIGQNKWSIVESFQKMWIKADENYDECLNNLKNKVLDKTNELTIVEKQATSKKDILQNQLENYLITKKQYSLEVKKVEKKVLEIKKEVENTTEKVENVTFTHTQKIEKELGTNITKIITNKITDTKDKRKIVDDSINQLVKDGKIKEEKKEELLKQTESLINKTHGTIKEQSAIDIFEEKFNITLDTSQKYFKHLIKSTDTTDWYIGGKLDGIARDYIVEVKNRTKGFFSSLRDYESTQIQLYLLITKYSKAKLVEKFNNNIRITDIEIDNNYIKEILEYLNLFIDKLILFIDDHSLKMKYLNATQIEKEKILNNLYLYEITDLKNKHEECTIAANQTYISDLDSDNDF